MSTPPVNSSKSPPPQWLSNDDKYKVTEKSSDHGVPSRHGERATSHEAGTSNGGNLVEASTLPMSYPIDENLFYSAPSQQLAEKSKSDVADEETTDPAPATEELPPPPDFRALFTLIEDPETGDHYHPTVHYIFSDDDPEILTSAALEVLDRDSEATSTNAELSGSEERHVIVDMAVDGKLVTNAASMSPDWQALKTTIRQAPSWGDDTKNTDRGLMLKIAGQDSKPRDASRMKVNRQPQSISLEDLLETFTKRLDRVNEVHGTTQPVETDMETTK